jgi:UDP-N-acetylglucosamine 2-epimerase
MPLCAEAERLACAAEIAATDCAGVQERHRGGLLNMAVALLADHDERRTAEKAHTMRRGGATEEDIAQAIRAHEIG